MTLDDYQIKAKKTAIYPKEKGLEYCLIGLIGETGEFCNKYKKIIRDNNGIISEEVKRKLMDELSDCYWYLAMLTTELGYSMDFVANHNINKLQNRQQNNTLNGSGDNR